MIAVAVVAGLLAVLRFRRELLPVLIVVGIPMMGLYDLLAKVPRHRPAWRTWIAAAMLGYIILVAGWLWIRLAIGFFPRQQGSNAIDGSGEEVIHQFWAFTLPGGVTAICLVVYMLGLAIACALRRPKLLPLVMGYALALVVACTLLVATLAIEDFGD